VPEKNDPTTTPGEKFPEALRVVNTYLERVNPGDSVIAHRRHIDEDGRYFDVVMTATSRVRTDDERIPVFNARISQYEPVTVFEIDHDGEWQSYVPKWEYDRDLKEVEEMLADEKEARRQVEERLEADLAQATMLLREALAAQRSALRSREIGAFSFDFTAKIDRFLTNHSEPVEAPDTTLEALRWIAGRPIPERNPDGDDQAAEAMRLTAREVLKKLGEPVEAGVGEEAHNCFDCGHRVSQHSGQREGTGCAACDCRRWFVVTPAADSQPLPDAETEGEQ
jgi:hypothetical protein